jgi:hypothetical protein
MKPAYKKPEKKNKELFEFKYTNTKTGKAWIVFEYSVIRAEEKMYKLIGTEYRPTEFKVAARKVK